MRLIAAVRGARSWSRRYLGRWSPGLHKRGPLLLSIAVLLAAALLSRYEPAFFAGVRESLFDAYQRLRPRPHLPAPVRVVDIDEASLARLGQWPWPRARLAELLQKLHDGGAVTVALDILLAEPDRTSPSRLLPLWADMPGVRELVGPLPDYDAQLAATIAHGIVVTGFALVDNSSTAAPALKAGMAFVGGDPPTMLPGAEGAVTTLASIEQAARGNGSLSISLSTSGVVRSLPLVLQVAGGVYPSLAAEALRTAQGADSYAVRVSPDSEGVTHVRIGAYDVPTDAAGQLRLYASAAGTQRYLPAWKVIAGEIPASELAGTIAIIGSTARGLQDIHQTPLGNDIPGVEFHAQALEQIIHEDYLRRPNWAKGAEIILLLGLGTLVLVLGSRRGATWAAVAGGACVIVTFAASWAAFAIAGLLFDPLSPAAAVFGVYVVFSLLRHLRTEREQRWIRKAFASYISPKLVEQLVEQPDLLKLGGERRELTFLFTDLEGFTPLVEQHPPSVTVPTLNAYLDGLIQIAFAHDGTVDKIYGDAINVMFGAPIDDPHQADRAIACALDIDRFAQSFAAQKRAEGLPFGQTRIGVNSGPAIVGNFGGALRFDFTAHGDTVNTASRLEGANKYLGTRICVSEETAKRCRAFTGRPVATLLLKGKRSPTRVFEPLPEGAVATPAMAAYLRAFRLLEADAAEAAAAFAEIVRQWPQDGVAGVHLRRLQSGATGSLIVLSEK